MSYNLKDVYNRPYFEAIANAFSEELPSFSKTTFLETIFDSEWNNRELKERMRHATKCVHLSINLPFPKAAILLMKVNARANNDKLADIFFPDYIETYGQDEKHLTIAIDALKYLTTFSTSEFAIRPFIQKQPEKLMSLLLEWTKDKNVHVRRLASEGCRPRLPWGMALKIFQKDPSPILKILEILKADEEDYVRRSVANNLNDISKDHPQLIVDLVRKWQGKTNGTDWIVKHACRTLLKKGNPNALVLFGFAEPQNISIQNFNLGSTELAIGEQLDFSFTIENTANKEAKIRVEYAIDYVKSNGSLSRKVFMISEREIESKGTQEVKKHQWFKELTTRKHYPGKHRIHILVNGVVKSSLDFMLK